MVGYLNCIFSLVWFQTTKYALLKLSLESSLLVKHLCIINEVLLVCVQSELDVFQAWRTIRFSLTLAYSLPEAAKHNLQPYSCFHYLSI